MRPHVLPEVGALYEGLRALRANERLLAGVGAVVRVPRRLVAESFVAVAAGVRLVVGVHAAVRGQQPRRREPLAARVARARTQPRVPLHVRRQRAAVRVTFVTEMALVLLLDGLAGVHARVSAQRVQLRERLPARLARVALRIHVPVYVPPQQRLRVEFLLTFIALPIRSFSVQR